jgi:hypothetical protein
MKWDEMRWNEMRWDEMRWDELKIGWNQMWWFNADILSLFRLLFCLCFTSIILFWLLSDSVRSNINHHICLRSEMKWSNRSKDKRSNQIKNISVSVCCCWCCCCCCCYCCFDEMRWDEREMKWNEMRWDEMRWSDC